MAKSIEKQNELASALALCGVKTNGIAVVSVTADPATFILVDGDIVRVDWPAEPSQADIDNAVGIIAAVADAETVPTVIPTTKER